MGVHTSDDGKKTLFKIHNFLRKCSFKKMLWLTLLSVEVQSNKLYGENYSSELIVFVIEKKVHEKISLKFSMKFTNVVLHECWKNLFNLEKKVSRKIIFHEFFWTTFLTVGVRRTDDRREKIFFGKSMFPLEFVYPKRFWLVWYDSSMGVHTHDDKIEKKLWRKNLHWVFFQKRVLNNIVISGSTECKYSKTKNSFPSNFFWL